MNEARMTFDDGKKDARNAWDSTKEAAGEVAEAVTNTAKAAGDELKEIADGEDR